tara:strand:+ start:142 stop:402 length:261 start_codon:yes stop_codon:yes gene_type:complete
MISLNTLGMNLLVEAFFVGIAIVIMGTLVSGIFAYCMKSDLPPVCKDWNKNYIMEMSLFFTGFISHLLFEFIGLNKWYCKNGVACK